MRGFGFLLFVLVTFCCWGIYGPVLHIGQAEMSGVPGKLSSLRPFICVGVAYFLIAVAFPLVVLRTKGEQGNWTMGGAILSFVAGAVGAIGALGIILAFKFQGKPVYVMPLVFGLAPIVNTLVTMIMARTYKQASALFYLGIIIVALGAAGVLTFKPKASHAAHDSHDVEAVEASEAEPDAVDDVAVDDVAVDDVAADDVAAETVAPKTDKPNPFWIGLSIAVTALCWGAYGPVLHKGQARMNGSRLRPFLCVGLAYFAIAVIVPLFLLGTFEEPGGFQNIGGALWSLAAGAAGAIGALGIIYAFNFGGKPIFVMPLVFGFAPVINTFTETFTKGLLGQVSTMFFVSLSMVIAGAVIVLVFAPRGKPPVKAAS